MNYSGILGVFPNVMVIAHGASGDGKSVALWMDTQIMHFWRKKTLKRLKKTWQATKDAHDAWEEEGKKGPEPAKPGPEPTVEALYDKGSVHGMGQQMAENSGRVYLIKHEGKTYPNGDYNEAVTVMAALHEKDGVTYGLRSTSVGDWMLLGNKRYEVASMGFKEVNLEPKEGK